MLEGESMRVTSGPAVAQPHAQQPVRWSAQERAQIYQHVLRAPGGTSGEARPNREFADLWLRFVSSVAQLGRQGRTQALDDRALSAARELADKAGPLVDSAWAARDVWQVVDQISTLELGGAANSARHRTMAESGGAILEWLAARRSMQPASGDEDDLVNATQQWLAVGAVHDDDVQALSQPEASRRVTAWSQALRRAVGLGEDHVDGPKERAPRSSVLFSGPSGTGKTMAAHWLAASLGSELHRIDLSQVVSKYIGETEKNIDAVLERAQRADAVLLFDEADALLGKRSEVRDSHDRYANIEVSYLLQRIESYEGLAILTTNLREHIDPAVLRRLRAVVAFPIPLRPPRG
jgi:ATP-dependent Clp protease ATP-binding subunit ClpA